MTIASKLAAMVLAPFMAISGTGYGTVAATPQSASVDHASTVSARPNNGWHLGNFMSSFARGSLRITNINAPTKLAVGDSGTWTVNASSNVSGNLRYSVVWGDEDSAARALSAREMTRSSATFTHVYDTAGTYQPVFTVTDNKGRTVTKAAASVVVGAEAVAQIDSISPAKGPAGTVVTLTGSEFASSNTVYLGNSNSLSATASSDTSLTFTIPATTQAGTYQIWVDNGNGASNAVAFEVTATPKVRISVNGIDAPTKLAVGDSGTWTVNASSNVSGNLRYSVVWGDENMMSRALRAVTSDMTQSSASFTHAYDIAGTYQPVFTVTDVESGKSVTTSATVRVTSQ